MQTILDRMERHDKWSYEHLKLMIRSGNPDIPSEPDTPSEPSEEEADDHEEEARAEHQQAASQQAEP